MARTYRGRGRPPSAAELQESLGSLRTNRSGHPAIGSTAARQRHSARTEVLHVYSTGLNGSLPHDMPAEQSSAICHLRGAYGPSMSQMVADQNGQPAPAGHLPRAPLRSHAEYIEFCQCLLDDEGHRRDILEVLGVADSSSWIRYSARFATLPPLPAQLALPA